MNTQNRILMGAAIAGLVGASAAMSTNAQAKSSDVQCMGVNSCKGKGACKTADNSCKGQNGCKGKGMMKMSKKKCLKKGGTVMSAADAAPAAG